MIDEMIDNWKKELEVIKKARKTHNRNLLTKTVLIMQRQQVLLFIKDLKKLKAAERN